jgi:hypothetical protein
LPNAIQRKVTVGPSLKVELHKAVPNNAQADEILGGIIEYLTWKAEFGEKLTGAGGVYTTQHWDLPNGTLIRFYYQFNDNTVTIIGVALQDAF